jgi:hypothetical protein
MKSTDILELIKRRQGKLSQETPEQKERRLLEQSMRRAPVSADDFQEFKRKFVDEYGGEKVQDTGMTHSEFLQYIKNGIREGDSNESNSLRRFLNDLDKY